MKRKSKVVLVCGDRKWTNWAAILTRLSKLPPGSTIVEGDAKGADRIAGHIAKALGFKLRVFPAKWGLYGKAAGPIRNWEQFEKTRPHLVIAFHNNLHKSRGGTRDIVALAYNRRCRVELIEDFENGIYGITDW